MSSAEFQKESFTQIMKIQALLLTVLFVGLAADMSLDKSSLDLAREQLASISDVTVKWNEKWLSDFASQRVESLPDLSSKWFQFMLKDTNERVLIELSPGTFQVRPLPNQLENLISADRKDSAFYFKEPTLRVPHTLSDFWVLWDMLNTRIQIFTNFKPIDVVPIITKSWGKDRFEGTITKVEPPSSDEHTSKTAHRLTGHVYCLHPADQDLFKKWAPTHRIVANLPLEDDSWRVTIPVTGEARFSLNGQDIFIQQFRPSWHLGPSKDVFRDLHSIAENFTDLPLPKIKSILDAEANRYGERLSLLGVNLPRGQLAVWSLILVTIICSYFLILLRSLASNLKEEGLVVAYPWIAVLPGKVPIVVSIFMLCFMPGIFSVLKLLAIWQLEALSLYSKLVMSAFSITLLSLAMLIGKTLLRMPRRPVIATERATDQQNAADLPIRG